VVIVAVIQVLSAAVGVVFSPQQDGVSPHPVGYLTLWMIVGGVGIAETVLSIFDAGYWLG